MQSLDRLRDNIRRCFLGNQQAIDRLVICLMARGHMLIEDVPGVGKTILATTLATVWDQQKSDFIFKPGPIFTNIVLADEINRTTPRTQSSLLEAMNEGQVSIDGNTRKLIDPFIVIATQNPFEFEGTYFLPESQLDRFLMRIRLGYPNPEDEAKILALDPLRTRLIDLKPVMTTQVLVELQHLVDTIQIDPALIDYVVQIAGLTRGHDQLQIGVSPRGTLAMIHAAKAAAVLHDRDYVVPEDIISNVISVFAHRVVSKSYAHDPNGVTAVRVMQQVLETVPSPV